MTFHVPLLCVLCCITGGVLCAITPTWTDSNSETYIASQALTHGLIYCQASHCNIDCDGSDFNFNVNLCASLTINASQSNSLSIRCSKYGSCSQLNLTNGPKQNLSIDAIYIENATLHAPDTLNVTVSCSGFGAQCNNIALYIDRAQNANITCRNSASLVQDATPVCTNFRIFGDHVSDVLLIDAIGNFALNNAVVYARYATDFVLSCTQPRNDWYGTDESEIIPYGSCNGRWFVPAVDRFTIKCFAYGCWSLGHVYVASQTLSLNTKVLKINGCGLCRTENECVSDLQMYCQSNDSNYVMTAFSSDNYDFESDIGSNDTFCPHISTQVAEDKKKARFYTIAFVVLVVLLCCYCCGSRVYRNTYKIQYQSGQVEYRVLNEREWVGCCKNGS